MAKREINIPMVKVYSLVVEKFRIIPAMMERITATNER